MRLLIAVLLPLSPAALLAAPVGADPAPAALPTGDAGEVRSRLLGWQGPALPSGGPLSAPVSLDRLSSAFGVRADPYRGLHRPHDGLDVPGISGTPVRAAADGVVARARRAGSYGNLVEIDHGGGLETRYAHLSQIAVVSGSMVRRGDIVGLMGSTGRSTGSHLHFEVRLDGRAADPLSHVGGYASPLSPAVTPRWTGWHGQVTDRLPTASID